MTDSARPDNDRVIAQLRSAIGAIEATSADLVRRPLPQEHTAKKPKAAVPEILVGQGVPDGDDWMEHLPPRIRDGEQGFDRRLMTDLDAVGVRCLRLVDLQWFRTIPQGIPVFVDWVTHFDERFPGPDTPHRRAMRINLIVALGDRAARGNRQVIDLLIAQFRHQPLLCEPALDAAGYALARVATKKDFAQIAQLIEDLTPDGPIGPLIGYLGKVKTPEARDLALGYLDTKWTYFSIKALRAMKATGVRARVEPYLHDRDTWIREQARRAMKTLPQ